MVKIRRGLELPIAGEPRQVIGDAPDIRCVAILGADYPGMKPTMEVRDGDTVSKGQVIFTDKKCAGVKYTAPAGGVVKAVQLRKEMKHMVKKGQVFLYDDQSNVMYLMHAENGLGEEVTVADVESMEVQSIIWKDKKHHKKDKN